MTKGRWWIFVAVAGAVYLAVAGCVIFSADSPAAGHLITGGGDDDKQPILAAGKMEGLPYRGFAMQVQRIDNVMDYGRSVDKIAEMGLDTILFSIEVLYESYSDSKYRPCPLLRKMVDAGLHGRKNGKGFYDYGVSL